jgi:subtilisin-like proprotein convertase family protein
MKIKFCTPFRCFLAFLFLLPTFVSAQSYWTNWNENEFDGKHTRYIKPKQYRVATLDVKKIGAVLKNAPLENMQSPKESNLEIEVPAPDGSTQKFRIVEAPMMHPDLQAKYPQIRCYNGFNVDRPNEAIRLDLTPHGFHAMVIGAEGGSWFVDPYAMGDKDHYTIYKKSDYQKENAEAFTCDLEEDGLAVDPSNFAPEASGDCQFRVYRLALACTGEYATFHGGTVPLVLAAMNTSMNRVNGIFEREISARMVIIPTNNLIVYLTAATDPYSNGSGSTMLGQNQTNLTSVIGAANYDLGHVFSTGGGGVAALASICRADFKARGVTGSGQPIGDPFDVDYVAHEMGHQLGAQHTFYNSCGGNKSSGTAFEPGSGSTIMSYAGICAPNVQNLVDDYYHSISVEQMGNVLTTTGNTCGTKQPTTNTAPTVDAGADYAIPVSTPFALTAVGTDANTGNVLTYCWEQMNNDGTFTQPPVAGNAGGPMFRTYDPSTSRTRFFPSLQNINANTANTWEVLPSAGRTMNFRVIARDNATPGGCTAEDNTVISVVGTAGPFVVTAPNTNVTWNVGETQNVTWNVANTTAAPINTAAVKILLSMDGGLTYPVVLADGVPNSGTAMVTVPNNPSTNCRVKVEAKNNVYFDISNVNFTIQLPPTPTFILSTNIPQNTVCPGQSFVVNVSASSILGFNTPVQLSVAGLLSGVTASYSANPIAPGSTGTITLSGFTAAQAGALNLTVTATAGSATQTSTQAATILGGAPAAPALTTPAQNATGISVSASLSWGANPQATMYQVQVASSVSFAAGVIVQDIQVTTPNAAVTALNSSQVYFWRVRASNACGQSAWSAPNAFQTSTCQSFTNSTPVAIPLTPGTISSVQNITGGVLSDVNVSVQIAHTWTGDLKATLTGPTGVSTTLFDQPGIPATQNGCEFDNIQVTLDDQSSLPASALEGTCNTTGTSIVGVFQPIQALAAFNGTASTGNWTLTVQDFVNEDGGSLNNWGLQLCFSAPASSLAVVTNQTLQVPRAQSGALNSSLLNCTSASVGASAIQYMLMSVPANGILYLSGAQLFVGSTFTQADINNGSVSYLHSGNTVTSDQFLFQVVETNGGGWLQNRTFQIVVLQNTLAINASLTQAITCFNQNNATITAQASGGGGALTYSLNGGAYQSLNMFGGLTAGSYTVTVRDVAGFTQTSSTITVTNPADLQMSASASSNQITCAASGGTGALLYSLNGGAAQSSPVFSNLANGAYTCVVTDANGCTKSAQAIVAVNSLVVGAAVQSQILCNGQNNGSIAVTVGGGQAPYQYTLNTGVVQQSNVFTGLSAGTYTVVVSDAQGFSSTSNALVLNQPAAVTTSSTVNQNVISVQASGGTGTLQYSLNGGAFQSQPTFTVNSNGGYNIAVQDANACQAATNATVNVSAPGVVAQITAQITCFGQSTATITANGTGGLAPYQYKLNGGALQSGNTFSNLPAGAYTVGITDAFGGSATAQVNITQPSQLVATATSSQNSITAVANGGVSPYTYALNGGAAQASGVFNNLPNGNYSIIVKDANGCTVQTGAVVNVPALGGTANLIGTLACFGSATLSVIVNPIGGVPPYTFSLNGGASQTTTVFTGLGAGVYTVVVTDSQGGTASIAAGSASQPSQLTATVAVNSNTAVATAVGGTAPYQYSLNGGASQNNPTFGNLAAGNYTILVTDANGCTVTTQSFTVTVVIAPVSGSASSSGTINCFGDKTITVTATPAGGVPPYTFSLNGGTSQASPTFTGIGAGVYIVIITDSQGSSASVSAGSATQPSQLTATVAVNTNSATATATGGTPPYQYSLNNGPVQSSPTFSGLGAGAYPGIIITDSKGCRVQTPGFTVMVGLAELAEAFGMKIWPNPSAGLFQLELEQAQNVDLDLMVTDIQGRTTLLSQRLAQGQTIAALDLTHLATGSYVLKVRSNTASASTILLIQR